MDLNHYKQSLLALHDHICPRQILGLRMGVLAGKLLGLSLPQSCKRLMAFVETDGCFADGVMVATGCALGRRTMRLIDHGKIAVTFVDTKVDLNTGVRMWPRTDIRSMASAMCSNQPSRWHAQYEAYQRMPDEQLIAHETVDLLISVHNIVSRPGVRSICEQCGEEIINEREKLVGGRLLCCHCAGEAYFSSPLDFRQQRESCVFNTSAENGAPA
jgi:formylmethanofuran dehydrogenase subunit E